MLIGLYGHEGSGRDTAARFLEDEGFFQVKIIDEVRDLLISIDPLVAPGLQLTELLGVSNWQTRSRFVAAEISHLIEKTYESIPLLLGEGAWVEAALSRPEVLEHSSVVLSDVTCESEAREVQKRGGKVWHIARDDHDVTPFSCDGRIVNDSTRSELRSAVKDLTALARYTNEMTIPTT